MHQSKFSLADVLTISGAIGFGYFCFLGFNFLSFGDTKPSMIWAAVFALILTGLSFGAKILKMTSRNFKTCIIWEFILLFLFTGMSCIIVFPFSHYFTVSSQKTGIQQKVIANLTQAEGMFATYEDYAKNRLNIYKSRLNSISAAKNVNATEYRNYGFVDNISDSIQVENKIFTLKAQLFPSNYQEMKSVDSTWLASAKAITTTWKAIGIVNVINEVKKNLTAWESVLKQFSSFKAKGEIANDFEYSLIFDDVTDKFTELGRPSITSIFWAILFYTMMLLSYIITYRHSKHPGVLKVLYGKGNNQRSIITK
jgi:hypothetical protein